MEVLVPHGLVRLNKMTPTKLLRTVPVSCLYLSSLLITFLGLEANNLLSTAYLQVIAFQPMNN